MKTRLFFRAAVMLVMAGVCIACGSSPQTSAPDLTGVTTYYVRANGSDKNVGVSEDKPFKTLAKAVEAASKSSVKTITVIGTLTGQTVIKDSGAEAILITGKADASDKEKAVITAKSGAKENGIQVTGNSNIVLEYLTVTGMGLSGLYVEGKDANLTLGKGAVIKGNSANYGGGVIVMQGTLIMRDNAVVTDNTAGRGGGVAVQKGVFTMKDEASITKNTSTDNGGGVFFNQNTTMTMQDSASIANNTSISGAGGGLLLHQSTIELRGNATIRNNYALVAGGGIFCELGQVILRDNAQVTGNQALAGGGIFLQQSVLQTEDGVIGNDGEEVRESRHVSGNTNGVTESDDNILVNND